MASQILSFRDQAVGRIKDLLDEVGIVCAHSYGLISHFAGALLDYKEEGVELLPSIVLCESIQQFLLSFPGSIFHVIGNAALDQTSGPKILKECAPLSGDNWYVLIERDAESGAFNYGIFSYSRTPTAITLHEGINLDITNPSVLIRKTTANTIEIRGSKGEPLTLLFSTLRESTETSAPIYDFSKSCCASIDSDDLKNEFLKYFFNLLENVLATCHGTILICADELNFGKVSQLKDAVCIEPSVNFLKAFREFKSENSAEAILSLQRCEDLLQGFLKCDGMIVFNGSGCISAYRVFYKPSKGDGDSEAQSVLGGARRRAFEGMRELVGVDLKSILFRSQDGQTIFWGGSQ